MKKSRIFSTICGCFILAMSVYVLGGDADVEKGKNPDPNHTTSFLEWHRVSDLKKYKDKSFYAFIERNGWCTLGSSYDNQARSTSSTWSDQDGLWYMQNKKDDPYVDLDIAADTGYFLTKDTMNAPWFIYRFQDSSNCDSSVYSIQLKPCDKYAYVTSHEFHISDGSDNFTFLNDVDMKNKDSSVANGMPSATFKIFYNRSGSTDTFLTTYADWTMNAVGDSGWDDADYFKVFVAKEKYYSVIDEPSTIEKVFKIENDFLLKDGVTLTIPEGCTLTVTKGTFFVNGTINCKGTILVQEGATIVPFSPSGKGGQVNLIGGTLIVMPKAKVMIGLGKECLNSTQNATCEFKADTNGRQSLIVNHGLLAIGRSVVKDKTTIENHYGGRMFLGYNLHTYYKKFTSTSVKFDKNTSAATLGLDLHYGSFNPDSTAVIKAYEGSGLTIGNRAGQAKSVNINYYYYDASGNEKKYSSI